MNGWRIVRRIVGIGFSSILGAVVLIGFFAWLALHVRWEIPEAAQLSGPTSIVARDGSLLTRLTAEVDRQEIPLDRVSQDAIDAVVASEDARFYEHEGVDPVGLLRAVVTNVRTGAMSQGGSTLTQQYVKNAFTDADRTIMRKVREAVISIQLERELEKDEILERYLNATYFGEGAYGIEAAALTYFGVPASELSIEQGALLAQLLPAPSRRNPRDDPDGADARADAVIRNMRQLGMITAGEADRALAAHVEIRPIERPPTRFPHFVEHVRRLLVDTYGEERVLQGGLTVATTVDPASQEQLLAAVQANVPPQEGDPSVDAGAVAIDPRTGDLLALYGGRDFATNQVNLATQGRFQVGSVWKPFVFASALEQGIRSQARYRGPSSLRIGDKAFRNYGGSGYGRITMREALVRSVNTVYVQVAEDVGVPAIIDILHRAGVRSPLENPDDGLDVGLSIALGAPDVDPALGIGPTVLDVGSTFATLANDGVSCPVRTILEVRGPDGSVLDPPIERQPPEDLLESRPEELVAHDDGRCHGAIDANIARTTTQVLQDVVSRGTGTRAQIGRPQAGKTGTANEYENAWFGGYTPNLAMAIWVGHTDSVRSLRNIRGADRVWARVTGGSIPALTWRDAAAAILEDVAPEDFPEPGEFGTDGRGVRPAMRVSPPPPAPTSSATPTDGPTGDDTGGSDGGTDAGTDDGEDTDGEPSESPSPDESPSDGESDDGGTCLPPVVTSGCDDDG
ncbi:MAG: penicillin-binding protein [Actinobacteria bacterium]|nr:penicillin-binding protein [Actinomycetota bacterium]